MQPTSDSVATIDRALQEALRAPTTWWWTLSRIEWGRLSAEELVDLGCLATVHRAAQEFIAFRNRVSGKSRAVWFLEDAVSTTVSRVGTGM